MFAGPSSPAKSGASGLRACSASVCLAGIRPVLTWKSTAAAPTPIRLGATEVPCASSPWQVAQFLAKRSAPLAIDSELGPETGAAAAPDPVRNAYPPPRATSISRTTA